MLDAGHISSGIRLSRTYAASRPSSTVPSSAHGDVVDDPHAVAEPVGAAPLDRLPDRRQPERLAGVDGEVGVLALEVLERVQVPGGRVARLGAGDVEADHARVAVGAPPARRSPSTRAACRIAVSSWRTTIRPAAPRPSPSPKPSLTASTTSSRVSPLCDVLLGGVADLGVDHAVRGQVLARTRGRPGAARRRSASPRRCGRTSPGSAPASRSRPPRRTSGPASPASSAGQLVADLGGEVDDRLRAQPAVEVVVEQHLGGAARTCRGSDGRFGRDVMAIRPSTSPTRGATHARLHARSTSWPPPSARTSAPPTGSTIDQERVDRVRRRHRRPPVDPRRRRAGRRRARSAAPSRTATSPCR